MTFPRQSSLEDWLSSVSTNPELGVLSAVKVQHLIMSEAGGMQLGDEVVGRTFAVGKKWSAKDEAALIQGKCNVFSQALRGEQTFKVFAYYGREEPGAFHHINASGRLLNREGETEDASPRGMAAQGMRMGDTVVNRSFGMMDRLWQVNEHLMTTLERQRDHYETRALEAETLVLGFIREKVQLSHSERLTEMRYERTTLLLNKAITLLPALMRHITGKDLVGDAVGDTAILESVALAIRQMTPDAKQDTMTKLAGVSPELMMVLAPRLSELSEKQEKEEEAARLLAQVRTEDQKAADAQLAAEAISGQLTAPTETPRLNS